VVQVEQRFFPRRDGLLEECECPAGVLPERVEHHQSTVEPYGSAPARWDVHDPQSAGQSAGLRSGIRLVFTGVACSLAVPAGDQDVVRVQALLERVEQLAGVVVRLREQFHGLYSQPVRDVARADQAS
jgi:hypothetical protein